MPHTLSRLLTTVLLLVPTVLFAQAPPAGPRGGAAAAAPRLSVTSSAWPDGGEIPMKFAFRGDNQSPPFEFQWYAGTTLTTAPPALQSYALIFHDIENSTMRGTADTLHWIVFNVPGTATTLPGGLAPGDLADGTINGAGLGRRNGGPGSYFGPGAGPGLFHHYVFEFYALDTKLTLPGTATREAVLAAMEGHVIGKAAYVGRFRQPAQ